MFIIISAIILIAGNAAIEGKKEFLARSCAEKGGVYLNELCVMNVKESYLCNKKNKGES